MLLPEVEEVEEVAAEEEVQEAAAAEVPVRVVARAMGTFAEAGAVETVEAEAEAVHETTDVAKHEGVAA